jgi:hypothetical protein
MKVIRALSAVALVGVVSPVGAADATARLKAGPPQVRTTQVRTRSPAVVAARRTTVGIGYSAVRLTESRRGGAYYVHVVCPVGRGAFSRTYCPTPAHDAYCPSALIVCR